MARYRCEYFAAENKMIALSHKRMINAVHFGESTAHTLLEDYAKTPESFLGLEALAGLANRFARTGLYMNCTWSPSDEEQRVAGVAAERVVKIVFAVAKTFVARGR